MRHEDWPARLTRYIDAHRATPFAWGEHDCVLFAAGWILEATGRDPIADLRGRWTDDRSALRLIAELETLRNWCESRLGESVSCALARRGDVALVEFDGRSSLGVVVGEHVALAGVERMEFVPLDTARMAWHV